MVAAAEAVSDSGDEEPAAGLLAVNVSAGGTGIARRRWMLCR